MAVGKKWRLLNGGVLDQKRNCSEMASASLLSVLESAGELEAQLASGNDSQKFIVSRLQTLDLKQGATASTNVEAQINQLLDRVGVSRGGVRTEVTTAAVVKEKTQTPQPASNTGEAKSSGDENSESGSNSGEDDDPDAAADDVTGATGESGSDSGEDDDPDAAANNATDATGESGSDGEEDDNPATNPEVAGTGEGGATNPGAAAETQGPKISRSAATPPKKGQNGSKRR
jgi:hypothetical protein